MTDLQNTTTPPLAYSECYVLPFFSFFNADNMAIMKTFKDKEFDLAIVDPPYGINAEQGTNMASRKQFKDKVYGWDNTPPPILSILLNCNVLAKTKLFGGQTILLN